MALPSRLPQLPSLGELLEHPRVKGLVSRVNRSTIAQRAGGFLEEVRASLGARAGLVDSPSLAHLAERLARRLLGEPTLAVGPVINATGIVLGDSTLAPPLPEAALHAVVQLAGEFHRNEASRRHDLERKLSELFGAETALATSSLECALTLALAAIAGNKKALLHGDVTVSDPIDWRWLAARSGVVVAPHIDDVPEGVAAIIRAPDAPDADSTDDLPRLASQARANKACLIDVAPFAGTIDPGNYGLQRVATVAERLAAGADVVVVDGAGLLAGPRCGLLAGRREVIERIAQNPLSSFAALDPLRFAAIDAVLRLYREDAADVVFQLPVWQLLSAPLANLQQRSQRLAALMSENSAILQAESQPASTVWLRWGAHAHSADSWVINLRPTAGSADTLAGRLAAGPYPIAARVTDQSVQLDLRSVFPRWDQQLVAAIDAIAKHG